MTALAQRRRVVGSRTAIGSARLAAMPAVLVTLAAIVGSVWWGYLAMRRADGLAASAFDQAYFQQLVWSVSQGYGFRSSFNPGDFLGLHFSPLLVVPAALQVVWPDARLLSLLQVIALGLAVPAAFLFVRAVLRPSPAAGWTAVVLTAPMIIWPIYQQQLRADFHTESLALPLVFLAGWAGLTRRSLVMFAAALVALTAKEDQVYPVAVMGLLLAAHGPGSWRGTARRRGLWLVGLAVAWAVIVFGVVKPVLRAGVTYDTDGYYAWLGQGSQLLSAPFDRTEAIVAALTRPAGWLVVGWLLVSLGGLAILRPRWLLLLVPPFVAHMLSRQIPQQQITLQYGLLLIVPAVVAAALGARRALAWWAVRRRRHGSGRHVEIGRIAGIGALVAVLVVGAAYGGGSVPPFSAVQARFWTRPPAIDRVRAIAAVVPPDATLAVDWGMASALASRQRIQVLTGLTDDAWLLLDADPYVSGYFRWADRTALVKGLPTSGRPLLVDDGRFTLWGPRGG